MSRKSCQVRRRRRRRRKQTCCARSTQGELQFPRSCVGRLLQEGRFSQRLCPSTPAFLSAILEHLTAYILELAADEASNNNKRCITPQHVDIAVHNDRQLGRLLKTITSSQLKML